MFFYLKTIHSLNFAVCWFNETSANASGKVLITRTELNPYHQRTRTEHANLKLLFSPIVTETLPTSTTAVFSGA